MFFLNYSVLNTIFVPDPCYYHFNEMNWFMRIFYYADSGSNGHPEPNLFNLLVTISIGFWMGIVSSKMILKKMH